MPPRAWRRTARSVLPSSTDRRRSDRPKDRIPMTDRIPYDEFSMFHENAAEYDIAYDGPPTVRRERVEVAGDRGISALVWGTEPPEFVLLHGGGQNAHTWDTVALALGRPLVAVDLAGHGHSDPI